jgi:Plant mobile domain
MIGAGRWRCSLGWMPIHTVMTTSPITRGRLRSRIGGKRTSTLISRYLVFDSRVCVNIFKSCLLTPMTTPSNGIIFTTNFTPFMNLFCRYTRVLTFFDRYTPAFCFDLFGSVMFPNNSADSVPAAYLTFLDDLLNVPEEGYNWGQAVLSCLYFNLCRSCLEPTDCIAGPVLLLQMWSWTKSYFVHILLTVLV